MSYTMMKRLLQEVEVQGDAAIAAEHVPIQTT